MGLDSADAQFFNNVILMFKTYSTLKIDLAKCPSQFNLTDELGWLIYKFSNFQSRFAVRNSKKTFLKRYWFVKQWTNEDSEWYRIDLGSSGESLGLIYKIYTQFGIIQVLQRSLIPETSNWSGTFFCCFLQQTGSREQQIQARFMYSPAPIYYCKSKFSLSILIDGGLFKRQM